MVIAILVNRDSPRLLQTLGTTAPVGLAWHQFDYASMQCHELHRVASPHAKWVSKMGREKEEQGTKRGGSVQSAKL